MKKPDIDKVKDDLAARLEKLKAADGECERIRARIAEVRAKFQGKIPDKKQSS